MRIPGCLVDRVVIVRYSGGCGGMRERGRSCGLWRPGSSDVERLCHFVSAGRCRGETLITRPACQSCADESPAASGLGPVASDGLLRGADVAGRHGSGRLRLLCAVSQTMQVFLWR